MILWGEPSLSCHPLAACGQGISKFSSLEARVCFNRGTHRHRGRNAIRHDASASLVPYPESDFGNTTCSSWTWQAAFFVGFNVASLETRLTQSSFSIIPVAGCFPQGPRRGMAIEIVSFPTKNGDVPVRYVKIPEGNSPDCYPINCPMVIP